MNTLNFVLVAIVCLVLGFMVGYRYALTPKPQIPSRVSSFEECVKAGNPVRESYPRQCADASGKLFVEEVSLPPIDPGIGNGEGGEGVYCTMDAKVCPDGSSVGRVGPQCEFAPCPGER